jgi:MFS family permease
MMEQIKKTLRDKAGYRWAMMVLVSLLMAANYYFYDALSPLKSILQEHLNFTSHDFGIVAGFYAFPNTFLLMAILGGVILDKMGIRPTGLLFAVFMLIGAFLTAYGASDIYRQGGPGYHFMGSFWPSYTPELKMMSLGMLIFGLLVVVHLLLALTTVNPYLLMIVLGIAFSLVPAAMWPAVSRIVPEHRLGSAYGTMFSLQNLGLFAIPILAGMLLDATNPGIAPEMIDHGAKLNYTPTMLMFAFLSALGFLFALLLKWDDKTSGYGLELPSNHSKDNPLTG